MQMNCGWGKVIAVVVIGMVVVTINGQSKGPVLSLENIAPGI